MGILLIIFTVMIIVSLLAIVLLFINGGKYGENTVVFNSIAMWAIFISWIDITSLPVNYTTQPFIYQLKMGISILFGAMSILAVYIFFMKREKLLYARVIMTGSIAGGLMGLLL